MPSDTQFARVIRVLERVANQSLPSKGDACKVTIGKEVIDAVVLKATHSAIYVKLADGSSMMFRPNKNGQWVLSGGRGRGVYYLKF